MSTQNLNTGPAKHSGHKEATEDHTVAAKLESQAEGGDYEALMKSRILDNSQVSRAALYDESDFLCVASSPKQFNVEPHDIRKILDGLLTFARQGDPTAASGDGQAPQNLKLGSEGSASVKTGNADYIVAELSGKLIIASRTAKLVLIVEGADGANQASLENTVQSFTEGLQKLTDRVVNLTTKIGG
ncbi:hypothetical protein L486_06105 [Kwoniella mangroviensis CBS 10435]|uniref:Profilin n=1 Tax=Kwoniella mangroviensis CBS 10435 TaxID=1331196 RepID=A0A1B9ILC5_9TREE|nr:uncharacterized protein I203_05811 [Kwoniella mangroviensis CBS 8507]OCF56164.1 hypothetical protein L486_06105 [Kwoniella mangroviensis CBS 10435]OCF65069.1 hypothetical protein I203_05811 [Kwoniella mangroviensis CBS 8507]OCF78913.1 hypothetical protein I204_00857 [Kwoniella mangroviensis CBS 8886]